MPNCTTNVAIYLAYHTLRAECIDYVPEEIMDKVPKNQHEDKFKITKKWKHGNTENRKAP